MQKILELQKRLKEVQSQKSASHLKLNERNVVDIVQRMVNQQRVQLIYTLDGKEYLTPQQLEKEILQLVDENGGRVALKEMPSHIGVGIEVIEPVVLKLCGQVQAEMINGSMITQIYLNQIVEEISELVLDQGRVSISDLTNKYWLPLEYLKDLLTKKEKNLPDGCQILHNHLITKTFAQRQLCKIRGILRAVTKPTSISQLSIKYQVDEMKLKSIVDELTKSEQISGKMSKGLYIPTSFTVMQVRTVRQYFEQNQYIEKVTFEKLQIDQSIEQFLKNHYIQDNGKSYEESMPVIFSQFALSQQLYQQIEDQVNEIVKTGTYLNLAEVLPGCFKKDEQIQELLTKIDQTARLLPDQAHLCSQKFLQKCLALFVQVSEAQAIQMIKKGQRPEKIAKQNTQEKPKPKSSVKGKKKGKVVEDEPEDPNNLNTDTLIKVSPLKLADLERIITEASSNGTIIPSVDELLIEPLAKFLQESVSRQFWQILIETSERSSTKANAKDNATTEKEAEQQFQNLKFILKQAESIKQFKGLTEEQYQSVIGPVKAHLCKTQAQSLLNKLYTIQAFHNGISLEKLTPGTLTVDPLTDCPSIVSAQDRLAVGTEFILHIREILSTLNQLVQDKNLDDFMGVLSEQVKNLAARLGKQGAIDKKVERQIKSDLLLNFTQTLDEWLQAEKLIPTDGKIKHDKLKGFKVAFANAMNVLSLRLNCFLGLVGDQALGEEWALRICVNVLSLALNDTTSSVSSENQELKIAQLKELLECLCPDLKQKDNPILQEKVLTMIDQIVKVDE